MRTIISIIILIIMTQASFAQFPGTISHYSLVNTGGLDQDFLLFIPDTTTKILINPSRAASYDENFIYTNYYTTATSSISYSEITDEIFISEELIITSDGYRLSRRRTSLIQPYPYAVSSLKPDVSIVTLFNAFGSKWLLNISNAVSNSSTNNFQKDTATNSYDDSYEMNQIRNNYNSREGSSDNSSTKFMLSKIGESKLFNYSIGLFGYYNQDKSESTGKDLEESNRTYYSGYLTQITYQTDEELSHNLNNNNNYQIGLSLTLNYDKSDYIGRISYWQSDMTRRLTADDILVNHESITNDTIPNFLQFQRRIVTNNSVELDKIKPKSFQFYNYYQRKLNFISHNDHVFLRLNGFYSTANKSYRNYSSVIYDRYSYSNDTTFSSDMDTSLIHSKGKSDVKNWGVNLSLGYMTSISLSDLTILTGLNPRYDFFHIEDQDPSSRIIDVLYKIKQVSMILPVYISYTPRKWIEIYGGLNYNLIYAWYDREYDYIYQRIMSSNQIESRISTSKTENDNFSSTKSSYLGVNLKHNSGLRCMIYFGNDITAYKTWNISLGYHF